MTPNYKFVAFIREDEYKYSNINIVKDNDKSSVKTLLSDRIPFYNDLRRVNCYYYL